MSERGFLAIFAGPKSDHRMNRAILRLALPNIVSNITVPVMGIASTVIAGNLGGSDPTHTIGSLAIGVSIFNFIYWNCSFLRMGTSGLTAQAYGARDDRGCTYTLARTLVVALVLGLVLVALQYPIGEAAIRAMNGNDLVAQYFYARIWAVPAGIMLFGFSGWFIGMQNATAPMVIAILQNLVHVACSLWFCFRLDMGIAGIGYASVAAQYLGAAAAAWIVWRNYRRFITRIDLRTLLDLGPIRRFMAVNRDIILRTLCIVAVYTFFTAASARMEDPTILAVNTILLQLFTLFSYMTDGFAQAAEALTGRFIGARDGASLRRAIRTSAVWSLVVAALYVLIYLVGWRDLLRLFTLSDPASAGRIIATAGEYIAWIIAIPIASSLPFLMDGIMVGATRTRVMRDSMLLSTLVYFGIFFSLRPLIGNDALWCAFLLYMMLRGVLQYLMTHRLRDIYRAADEA